jgi:hypothetical protein
VRVRIALIAVLLNAAACAQDAGSPPGGGGGSGAAGGGGAGGEVRASDGGLLCKANLAVELDARFVDVLIVLDASESMGIAFGPGTRYSVLANLLTNLVDAYQSRIRFGLARYPGADAMCLGQAVVGCCVGPPSVEVALGNGEAMQEALDSGLLLAGNTPTASALSRASDYYAGLDDGIVDRFILLATDGLPSCTLSGQLSSNSPADADSGVSSACQEAVAQVQALSNQGINVLVLAVGAELTDDPAGPPSCLDQMAQAGGMPSSLSGPAYYSAASPESLQTTIESIFGGLVNLSCRFELDPAPTASAEVSVELDGQPIPRDRSHNHGWDFDPPGATGYIRIFGEYCDRIRHFRYSTVGASYTCPPQCANEIGCQ